MPRKLRLDLDQLQVESFSPLPTRRHGDGTVFGLLDELGEELDSLDPCIDYTEDGAPKTRRNERTCGGSCVTWAESCHGSCPRTCRFQRTCGGCGDEVVATIVEPFPV